MHESCYRSKAAAILRKRWSREFFIEEACVPFGTARISDRRAYPDILRIFPDGTIGLVEIKRWGSSDLEKWKILGELQFYTFLVETQYKQDCNDYHWMVGMIRRGLLCQEAVDALEDRILRELPLVRAWAVLIIGGERAVIEQDERIWHLYDYVNLSLDCNSAYRPISLLHYSEGLEGDSVDELQSWYSKADED
jgi:hypothetical protein